MNWRAVRFSDYTEFINGGAWNQSEYTSSGIPVVKVTNLVDDSVDMKDLSFIPESSLSKYKRHLLKKDDLVLTTVGSHPNQVTSAAGRAIIIPAKADGFLLNQNAVCIRSNSTELDQKFLGYIGKSPRFQGYIKSIARGAANQVRIPIGLIKEFELLLPSLQVQQHIASTLSAYDDLIENNLRRIQLLEEAVKCQYKLLLQEAQVESVLVKETLEYYIGGGWGEEEHSTSFTEPAYVIRGTDIPDIRLGNIYNIPKRYHRSGNLAKRKLEKGDIVFEISNGQINNIGRTALISNRLLSDLSHPIICASFAKLIRVNSKISPEYLYMFLNDGQENGILYEYKSHGTNGINNFAFETFIEECKIPIPLQENLAHFTFHASKIFDLISNLGAQNLRLKTARDILLHRLMNCEINLSQTNAFSENLQEQITPT